MKKLTSLILTFCMLSALFAPLASLAMPVSAAEKITITSAKSDTAYNNGNKAVAECAVENLRPEGGLWYNGSTADTPAEDSEAAPGERYVTFGLGETADISKICIQWYQGGGSVEEVKADKQRSYIFKLCASTDGKSYTQIYPATGEATSGTGADFEEYKCTFAGAKYVRIYGYGNDGGADGTGAMNFAIRNFEVYGEGKGETGADAGGNTPSTPSEPEILTGTTGDCTWKLERTVLTISGNGAMASYNYNIEAPWCGALTSVVIEEGVTNIGNLAFDRCRALRSVTIPDSVTSIGEEAFSSCDSLTSVTIPDSVTSIGGSAFSSCDSLTSVTIPDSVTSIGRAAFSSCDSLTSVTIPDSVTSIGDYAFCGCKNLTSITIPDSVTSIGSDAFRGCTGLTSVTIPNSVTSIGVRAFSDCTALTSITIPDSVTSIRGRVFYNCTALTSITIPDSVTSIGERAFYNCNELTIYGNTGSYAETYAEEYSITFVDLNYSVGDCNGDWTVGVSDIALLAKRLAGWDVEVDKRADCNGDGQVLLTDLALLVKYLAGWDVSLG